MDFSDRIRELIVQLDRNKDLVSTEEATKTSLVMPFLKVLGYDVFDPTEVIPEYTADWVKKEDKVDYGITFNKEKEPTILIEVKPARTTLLLKNIKQLFSYFGAVTKSKFTILTNGIQYQFYSDLDDKNTMDKEPFFTVDLTPSIRDSEIKELRKFHKDYFNPEEISSSAQELKYTIEIKQYLKQQIDVPEEEFVRFFIKQTSFHRKHKVVTKQSIDRFSPIVRNAFKEYVRESRDDFIQRVSQEIKKEEAGETKEGLSEKEILRHRFWTQLLGYAKTKTNLHAKISPTYGGWIGTGLGIRGLGYCYSVTKHQATAELYIDRGKGAESENDRIFDRLMAAKNEIERIFGGPLEWERLEGKRACRIKQVIGGSGYLDEQTWPMVQQAMVEAMIQLEKALAPQIQILRTQDPSGW